jgi:hypothetical protein
MGLDRERLTQQRGRNRVLSSIFFISAYVVIMKEEARKIKGGNGITSSLYLWIPAIDCYNTVILTSLAVRCIGAPG